MDVNENAEARPLTTKELKYLKRYNWLRLLKIFNYKFPIIIMITVISPLVYIIFFSLFDAFLPSDINPFLSGSLNYGVPSGLIAALVIYLWRKSANLKLWLSTQNLHAFKLTGTLMRTIGIGDTLLHSIDNNYIILPKHWDRLNQKDVTYVHESSMWVVKRPDTTNKILHYVFRNPEVINSDPYVTFEDHQYMALSWDHLSIAEEVNHKLPSIRANSTWCFTACIGLIFTLFAYISLNVLYENKNQDALNLQKEIIKSEKELGLNSTIERNDLDKRDLPELIYDPQYPSSFLVSDEPFDYLVFSLSQKSHPFILTLSEFKMIERVSKVKPDSTSGYGKVLKEDLVNYRNKIKNRIKNSHDISEKLKQLALTTLSTINDELLAEQMKINSFRLTYASDFSTMFLPKPFIYLPVAKKTYLTVTSNVNCHKYLFCKHSSNKENLTVNGFALINGNSTGNEAVEFIYRHSIKRIKRLKEEYKSKPYTLPFDYWILGLGSIFSIMLVTMLLMLTSYLQASFKIKSFYRENKNK